MVKEIKSMWDVFEHFDIDVDMSLDPATRLKKANERLDRSLYKYTSCGAWGKVEKEDVYERRRGKWTARYVRCQDDWSLQEIKDENGVKQPRVPNEVSTYFWPPIAFDELQKELKEILKTDAMEMEYTTPEEIDWSVKTGERDVFMVGSIVEGVDEEAETQYVYLPCTAEDLDAAVANVERDAEFIWQQTHGCEKCAERNGWEWPGCAIDEECPECGGNGVVI